jgi:hypothetical protein
MREQTMKWLADRVALQADARRLAEQVGTVEGLSGLVYELAGVCALVGAGPEAGLDGLAGYRDDFLVALEWPMILAAFGHVNRGELKELVALDGQLGREPRWQPWAAASARIGQSRLRSLRPLKDHRIIQRYQDAVEAGRARAWHPLVYGATLAVYTLPLRQALLQYAWIALRRRASVGVSCAHPMSPTRDQLVQASFTGLPSALDALLR